MGLTLSGTVLGIERRTVTPANGSSFDVSSLHVLSGWDKYELRVSQDFENAGLPSAGDDIDVEVAISCYPTRAGAAYNLTALRAVVSGARASA